MARGRIQLNPTSQLLRPRLMKDGCNVADSLINRMSQSSDSAIPPPAAGPLIAQITGCRARRRASARLAMCSVARIASCGRPSGPVEVGTVP